MNDEDYEKAYRYIEREFRDGNDYYLGLYLSQDIEEAKKEKRKSVLEYLFQGHPDFYAELFTTIFKRPKGGFAFYGKILPHLELKYLLEYLQSIIPESEEPVKGILLDIYQHYYNFLVTISLLYRSQKEGCLLPEEHIRWTLNSMLFGGTLPDIDLEEKCIDKEFIKKSRAFLDSQERNTLRIFENILLDLPFPDIYENIEYQYGHWAEIAKEDPLEARKLIEFYKSIIDEFIIGMREIDHAENIVDLLIRDFGAHKDVEDYYMRVKVANQKLEEIKAYIERKYSKEEIERNPLLLMYLSEYHQLYGEIPKAVDLSRKAYEVSNHNPEFFKEYCKVLLLKDVNEAKKTLRKYIHEEKKILSPAQILFLIPRFFKIDINFVKELLDYYSKNYPEDELQNRGINHITNLHLLSRYYLEVENYSMYESTLKKALKEYPDWESGYRKLSEFYSQPSYKKFYNLDKAIEYGKKCAELRGILPEYYIGICYLNSEEWQKAIEALEKFAEQNHIHPAYSRVYMHLFKGYIEVDDKPNACKWARKYLDSFDQPTRLQMYRDPTMDTESLLANDLLFFGIVAETCIRHRKRAERFLRERKYWVNAVSRSFEIQERILENKQLKERIVELEKELQSIKDEYRKVDLTIEENLEAFFEKIMAKENARADMLKRFKENLWDESEKNLEKFIPDYKSLPEAIQNFIHTSEFLILANHEKSDFSGVILSYAKAFETILDEKVSKPFIKEIGIEKARKMVTKDTDLAVKNLFPRNTHKPKSIGIGQWFVFIEKSNEGLYNNSDEITRIFESRLRDFGKSKIEIIRYHSEELKDTRNGSVHTSFISRKEAERDIINFRKAINDFIEIFYMD